MKPPESDTLNEIAATSKQLKPNSQTGFTEPRRRIRNCTYPLAAKNPRQYNVLSTWLSDP